MKTHMNITCFESDNQAMHAFNQFAYCESSYMSKNKDTSSVWFPAVDEVLSNFLKQCKQ